jgi:phage/plasmid primase-like uncharacterized protein
MRGDTLTITERMAFEIEECCNCGVLFALTADLKQHRLDDHQTFYCPNGHPQSYVGKTDAEKLREARTEIERIKAETRAKLQAEQDQRAAAERELHRHRQRARGGVCPCCKRSFVQLARHIKVKHPTLAASGITEAMQSET